MGRLRQRIQILLGIDDTPHRIALSFALGVYIAFFPVYGIHTGLALLVAFVLRLSRAPMLLGIWVNNPWTVAPMYMTGTLLGCAILGVSPSELYSMDWYRTAHSFRLMLDALRPYLWPFVVGNTVLGAAAGVVVYVPLRSFLERRRKSQLAASIGAQPVSLPRAD